MRKLKINFHLHTGQDPVDAIKHSEYQLIDEAARLGYEVLSITCHNAVIFNDDLKNYAHKKGILLIPGIEKSILRKHVLIINAAIGAQKIESFEQLREYRKQHPESLIVAAHPYYPGRICLGKTLEKQIDLFDAIEYSWYHSKRINGPNLKATKMAEKHGKPMLGTADNHILKYLNETYSLIPSEKTTEAIFKAIKANELEIVSHSLPWWKLGTIFVSMQLMSWAKAFALKR
jgi:predicted metal-dependent phosphoesterase TrpH